MAMGPSRFQVSVAATANLLIRNVMLDVSAASGPVTVTVSVKSSMDTDFIRIDGQLRHGDRRHQGWRGSLSHGGYRSNPGHRCWRKDGFSDP